MKENSLYDKKSLRAICGASADFKEIARDCIAFCNAEGGCIDFGIEDKAIEPPASQRIPDGLTNKLVARVSELTIGVPLRVEVLSFPSGGEVIRLHIMRNPNVVATTTTGQVFIRISDNRMPVTSEDLPRLLEDKGGMRWEDIDSMVSLANVDNAELQGLLKSIRLSDRVSDFVKTKTDRELLDYYSLTVPDSDHLTNLGVLFVGKPSYRARLNSALVVQCIKYDEFGDKVNKWVWDDFTLNPVKLLASIWQTVPDWRESYEISDGLFRRNVPAYSEDVVRELLANALVHRPYTVRGDIFINIHPDHVEVTNPGRLPLGVTPENILHKTVKRNEHMAMLFYVLHLMEREGSGYDNMYAVQLSQGKQVPEVVEGGDSVTAIVRRRIVSVEAIKLMQYASQSHSLKLKQTICLGLIAQHESVTSAQLCVALGLENSKQLRSWLSPLLEAGLVVTTSGKTSSVRYQVQPRLLRDSHYMGQTTLRRIEDYRIRELVCEDLKLFRCAKLRDINQRIGSEISYSRLLGIVNGMVSSGKVVKVGNNRWTMYQLAEMLSDESDTKQS